MQRQSDTGGEGRELHFWHSHSTSAPALTNAKQRPAAFCCHLRGLLTISSYSGLWIGHSMHPGILLQSYLVGHHPASVGPAWPWSAEPFTAAAHGPALLCSCTPRPTPSFGHLVSPWPPLHFQKPSSPVQQRLHCLHQAQLLFKHNPVHFWNSIMRCVISEDHKRMSYFYNSS